MAASHPDTDVPLEPTALTPAGHASARTPFEGGAPVLITEQQVRFATAAAGAASNTAAIRQPWISLVWQRLWLRPSTQHVSRHDYLYRRSSYFEHAAMAREMERL